MTCKLCKRRAFSGYSVPGYVCERCMTFTTILLDYQEYLKNLVLQLEKELPKEFVLIESQRAFIIETALSFLAKRQQK